METDEGAVHSPGETQQCGERFHRGPKGGVPLKTRVPFVSGTSRYVPASGDVGTKIMGREPVAKGWSAVSQTHSRHGTGSPEFDLVESGLLSEL